MFFLSQIYQDYDPMFYTRFMFSDDGFFIKEPSLLSDLPDSSKKEKAKEELAELCCQAC